MKKNLFKALFFILIPTILFGQNYVFQPIENANVSISGHLLSNAWGGGLNSIQVNKMDLNNDTIEDLILFDRTSSKLSTFIASNNQFIYAPEYESFFPVIINWICIADYNCDGKKDIFTSSKSFSSNILIYKNVGNSTPKWFNAKDGMKSKDGNGYPFYDIQVGVSDYPGITDIDGDGDLDFLVYSTIFGGIEFHKNNSVEKFSNCDSLSEFEKYHSCWGKMYIGSDCDNIVTLNQTCNGYGGTHDNQRVEHNGSTVTVLDLNGDGIKDILLGDVNCNNITALTNTGTNLIGKISTINPHFPVTNSINLPSSPATFYQDLDFDGLKDLTASPSLIYVGNATTEFTKSLSFYKNTGTNDVPNFSYVKNNFMQDEMIEVGENAAPALADYDHDGDLDLFIGNRGKFWGANFYATITLFENKGTRENAAFEFITDDYLSLSNFNLTKLKPGFADINNDGALDLYFFNNSDYFGPSASAQITYLLNQNSSNQPFSFNVNSKANLIMNPAPTIYSYDSPIFSDIDNNGLKDLLVGKENGYMYCYSNTGTALMPSFTRISSSYGGIAYVYRTALACAESQLNNKDTTELITIDDSGILRIYPNFKSSAQKFIPSDSNIILNKVNEYTFPSYFGSNLNIAVGDLTGDTLNDIIIGTGAGGLIFLKNMRKKVTVIKPVPKDSLPVIPKPEDTTHIPPINSNPQVDLISKVKVYPNPFLDELFIYSPESFQGVLINILGEKVKNISFNDAGEHKIDINNLPKGIYFLKIYLRNTSITFKLSKE